MLRIDLKPGESVRIGDFATITLEDKSGRTARIAFDADRSIPIQRVGTDDERVEMNRRIAKMGISVT